MLPELDDTLVLTIDVSTDGLEEGRSYVENWVKSNLESSEDVANGLSIEEASLAISDIETLLSGVIDSLTEEYYLEIQEVAKDIMDNGIGNDEVIEQSLDLKMPSDESLENWVSSKLDYEDFLDDFVEKVLDPVASELYDYDTNDIENALIAVYRENPTWAWTKIYSPADLAVEVDSKLDETEE